MTGYEFIEPVRTAKLTDGLYGPLRPEIIDWIQATVGLAVVDKADLHFVTRPGEWYYERHPRSDIGQNRWSQDALAAIEVRDCFWFKSPEAALLFKLTWL